MRQPARKLAHQGFREIDEPSRNPSPAHQLSGEYEEWNRQERERVESSRDPLRLGGEGRSGLDTQQHGEHGGNADGERNRHPEGQQDGERACEHHDVDPFHHGTCRRPPVPSSPSRETTHCLATAPTE